MSRRGRHLRPMGRAPRRDLQSFSSGGWTYVAQPEQMRWEAPEPRPEILTELPIIAPLDGFPFSFTVHDDTPLLEDFERMLSYTGQTGSESNLSDFVFRYDSEPATQPGESCWGLE
jgi:hypothetical protein